MTPARQIWAWLSPSDRGAALACGLALCGLGAALGQPPAALPSLAVLGAASLAILLIDGRHQVIPDLLTLCVALAGLATVGGPGRLIPAILVLGLFALFARGASRLLGRKALGAGDVKLIAAAALWLPWESLPTWIACAALSGLVESLVLKRRRLAFGRHLTPWLCLMVLLAGPRF